MHPSNPNFAMDTFISPKWISVALVILATALVYVGDTQFASVERLRLLHFTIVILLAAVFT